MVGWQRGRMATWVLDNAGNWSMGGLRTKLEEAAEIVLELRKLDTGGVVAKLDEATALRAMGNLHDWCASEKIRSHIPKTMQRGTTRLVIKNFHCENSMDEIIEMLSNEGVELADIYMIKTQKAYFTGIVKVTVKGSKKVHEWKQKGTATINGIRLQVEPERKAQKCYNCYRFGHKKAECTVGVRCRRCGGADHLAAGCKTEEDVIKATCGYCREEGHTKGECQAKRTDERQERENHRKENTMQIKNVWEERKKAERREQEEEAEKGKKSQLDVEQMLSKMQEQMQKQMQEQQEMMLQLMQQQMQQQMQEMRVFKDLMCSMMKLLMDSQQQKGTTPAKRQKDLENLKRKMQTPAEQKGARKTRWGDDDEEEEEEEAGKNARKKLGEELKEVEMKQEAENTRRSTRDAKKTEGGKEREEELKANKEKADKAAATRASNKEKP